MKAVGTTGRHDLLRTWVRKETKSSIFSHSHLEVSAAQTPQQDAASPMPSVVLEARFHVTLPEAPVAELAVKYATCTVTRRYIR